MATLCGPVLAGCGGEAGGGVDGEYSVPADAENVTEAVQTGGTPVEPEQDSTQAPGEVTAFATCSSKWVEWKVNQTIAWNKNPYTTGWYVCSGTLPMTAGGTGVTVYASEATRDGSVRYTCGTTGVWGSPYGTSCKGKEFNTLLSTTCADYVDSVRNMWISWYREDLFRCADTAGLDWWVGQYKADADCRAPSYNGFATKDACWRAQFRNGANMNGNSYNEAQALKHISSWDENALCGSNGAYTWDPATIVSVGTKCKYRRDYQ
jgi:hypothetical protein